MSHDKKVWYGMVIDTSEEFGDLLIKFMHPPPPHPQWWYEQVFPPKIDAHESDILCTIDPPRLTSLRGGYTISLGSLKKVETAHNLWDKIYL